jgi:hypothetical protein
MSKRKVPELVRCFYCGNPSTDESLLVWAEDRQRIVHNASPCDEAVDANGDRVYPDDDPETPIPVCGHEECQDEWDPCPPIPEGFGHCFNCLAARPLDRLTYTTAREVEPGKGKYGGTEAIVGLGISAADLDTDAEVAHFPSSDEPMLLCRFGGCAERTKETTARRVERDDEEDRDQARVDAVPSDGDGLRIEDLEELWGVSTRTARTIVARLVADGLLVAEDVPTTRVGGKAPKAYWRAP